MSNSTNSSASGGITFSGLLAIVFITLKLCHVIDWPWWWVTAPLWVPALIALVIILFLIVVLGIRETFK